MGSRERSPFSRLHGAYNEIVNVLGDLGYSTEVDQVNFEGSGKRAAKALIQMVHPWNKIVEDLKRHMVVFPVGGTGDAVFLHGILVSSICPHHLLPILYRVDLCYLPDMVNGKVLGLSKPARIVELLAARPVLQEEFARDIADFLCDKGNDHYKREEHRDPALPMMESKGSAVRVEGLHACIACRGVTQMTVTSASVPLRGVFFDAHRAKEFYDAIRVNRSANIVGV